MNRGSAQDTAENQERVRHMLAWATTKGCTQTLMPVYSYRPQYGVSHFANYDPIDSGRRVFHFEQVHTDNHLP